MTTVPHPPGLLQSGHVTSAFQGCFARPQVPGSQLHAEVCLSIARRRMQQQPGSMQARQLQRGINDASSRGPWAFLDFLHPHASDDFAAWTPYNLTAALHKIMVMMRSRSGCGLDELRRAGWQLGAAAARLPGDLDSRQLSNLLLNLRQLELWDLIQGLGPELLGRLDAGFVRLSAWDLSNALSGCAADALLGSPDLKAVFRTAIRKLARCDACYWQQWKAKDVANTAYALGLWRQSADDIVNAVDASLLTQALWTRTLELVPYMEAAEYVNVLWAMSEFRVEASQLCRLAEMSLDVLSRSRRDLRPDLLSRFASALAELCRRQGTENPQDRSRARTTEGSNYVNRCEQRFFEMVAEEAWRMTWPVNRRGRLVWSFACMRLRYVSLFEHVLGEPRWAMCSEGGLADICWALATVQPTEYETSHRLKDLLPHLTSRQLPQWLWLLLLWCFVVADISIPGQLQEHICRCLSSTGTGRRCNEDIESEVTEIDARMFDQVVHLLGWQAHFGSSFLALRQENPPMPSTFQRDVFNALNQLGFATEFETDGFDLVVQDKSLAIEVNGPSHYALDLERHDYQAEVGRSVLKRRLAAKKGYYFATIPWWEWDQALNQSGGRRAYLQSLVETSAFEARVGASTRDEAEAFEAFTSPASESAQVPMNSWPGHGVRRPHQSASNEEAGSTTGERSRREDAWDTWESSDWKGRWNEWWSYRDWSHDAWREQRWTWSGEHQTNWSRN